MFSPQQRSIIEQVLSLSPGLETSIKNSIKFVSDDDDPNHESYLNERLNLLSLRSGIPFLVIKNSIRGFLDEKSIVKKENKIYLIYKYCNLYIPASIGKQNILFHFDTGASDVFINRDTFESIDKDLILVPHGFLDKKEYLLADGSKVKYDTFILKELILGENVFSDVCCCISSETGPMLIGKSIFNRFSSYSIDNINQVLNYNI